MIRDGGHLETAMLYPGFRADCVRVIDIAGNSRSCTIIAPIDSYGCIDEVIVYDGAEAVAISSAEYRRLEAWIEQCREWDEEQEAIAYHGYMEDVRFGEYRDRYLDYCAR